MRIRERVNQSPRHNGILALGAQLGVCADPDHVTTYVVSPLKETFRQLRRQVSFLVAFVSVLLLPTPYGLAADWLVCVVATPWSTSENPLSSHEIIWKVKECLSHYALAHSVLKSKCIAKKKDLYAKVQETPHRPAWAVHLALCVQKVH